MLVSDITKILESVAPLAYQESYDNAGLLVGNPCDTVHKALITLDVTQAVVQEAITEKCDIIISHHPLIFKPLKKLNNSSETEKCIQLAVKNSIAIYACHTNLDSVQNGVNAVICRKLKLTDCRILSPRHNSLTKLVTFIPVNHTEAVQNAVFQAGAGCIGNYSNCGFSVQGQDSFCAGENTNPFVGKSGEIHTENEVRFETIFPTEIANRVISALLTTHPYEEVAYDLFPLQNSHPQIGDGMIGKLVQPIDTQEFLQTIKNTFHCQVIRHTPICKPQVQTVAVCGGSGSFLINHAIRAKADIFITSDVKYHDFFTTENQLVIADIGHYESEQFTKELIYETINKKNYNFAIQISKVNTNPINFL